MFFFQRGYFEQFVYILFSRRPNGAADKPPARRRVSADTSGSVSQSLAPGRFLSLIVYCNLARKSIPKFLIPCAGTPVPRPSRPVLDRLGQACPERSREMCRLSPFAPRQARPEPGEGTCPEPAEGSVLPLPLSPCPLVPLSASSTVIVGRIEGLERASNVLPEPGGLVINTLCAQFARPSPADRPPGARLTDFCGRSQADWLHQ